MRCVIKRKKKVKKEKQKNKAKITTNGRPREIFLSSHELIWKLAREINTR